MEEPTNSPKLNDALDPDANTRHAANHNQGSINEYCSINFNRMKPNRNIVFLDIEGCV